MKFYLLIAAVLGCAVWAQAQQAPVPSERASAPWSLQQCLDYAMANNIRLRQQRVAVEQSDVDIYAAQGQLFPSLQFATSQNLSWRPWSKQYVNVSNGTFTSSQSEVNYNGSYGLSAQWSIWNGGRNHANVKRSRLAKSQAEANTDATALDLQEQIIQAYVQILYQTEAVEVNRQILQSTKVQHDRAEQMVEVGTMSRADLAQMTAQVSQEEYNVANSITQLNTFKLNLKQLLQIIDSGDFEVLVPDNVSDDAVTALLPSVDDVYAAAVVGRPEIVSGELSVKLAQIDVDLARRQRYPTIGMNAGINTSNSSGINTDFASQLKTNLSNSIGVSISVPIFDNRSASSAIKRAKLSEVDKQLALDQSRTQLYSDIEQIWLNADNATEQYNYALVNTRAMQTSYDLVTEQFNVGLKDIVDLTTGKNNLIQARQQLLQAKYTSLLNRALLRFYQGEPLRL